MTLLTLLHKRLRNFSLRSTALTKLRIETLKRISIS